MKTVRNVIIGIICVSVVVGYYYYLSHKEPSSEAGDVTEVQKVILKDLDASYPATPREVVKFYNRILCCYYNEEYTEDEFRQLADQALVLMDQELADNNPAEQYYHQVKAEVEEYHKKSRTINNASVCDSNEVKEMAVAGVDYAYVTSSYFVRDNDGFSRSGQRYVLREDEEGKWRILAFELDEGASETDE